MFRRTIERELATLKRFMDDLRHLVKPKPIERFAMDVNGSVAEIVESMRAEGERNGLTIRTPTRPDRSSSTATASRSAACTGISSPTRFRRPAGGRVTIDDAAPAIGRIGVADTGVGHSPNGFGDLDDFVTTKSRGLGLGLAISKRIVEQLDGTITVASEVGRGTAFTLRFPARDDRRARRRKLRTGRLRLRPGVGVWLVQLAD